MEDNMRKKYKKFDEDEFGEDPEENPNPGGMGQYDPLN